MIFTKVIFRKYTILKFQSNTNQLLYTYIYAIMRPLKPGNEKEKMWILTNAIDPIFLRVTDDEGEKQTDNQYPVLKTLDSSLNESG